MSSSAVTTQDREQVIVRTSIYGILTNIALVIFKFIVGLASNSVAIISDAVNNLTDALSSVITILGAKLANRKPDKKHPLGHGRIEYMSAMVVSAIVLYAGITAFIDSVKKIIHPGAVDYSAVTLVILAAAVAAKLLLGAYTKKKGEQVNSGSLVASGEDASNDAILSASVLASAVIYMLFKVNIEAWVGAVIGIFIIKAGFDMIREALDDVIGVRVSGEITKEIKATIASEPEVHGVYDLLLNNYGPDRFIASVHIEVNDTMTAAEIDELTRRIQAKVYEQNHIILATIGIYSVNTGDDEAAAIRRDIRRRVFEHDGVIQFHGFYINIPAKQITFDIIIDFDINDRDALHQHILQDIQEAYPDYDIHITLDVDVTD